MAFGQIDTRHRRDMADRVIAGPEEGVTRKRRSHDVERVGWIATVGTASGPMTSMNSMIDPGELWLSSGKPPGSATRVSCARQPYVAASAFRQLYRLDNAGVIVWMAQLPPRCAAFGGQLRRLWEV
jgi:hypothetical protein